MIDTTFMDRPFDLFISYSSANATATIGGRATNLILSIKRLLEAHYHPTERKGGRQRRFRVCTFEEDFQLSSTVWNAMHAKLEQAAALLVVSSAEAAQSNYVCGELTFFRSACADRPLIAAYWNALPEKVFPEYFDPGCLAANFAPAPKAVYSDWRKQIEDESHKIVARIWSLNVQQVHDRFNKERLSSRRRLIVGIGSALIPIGVISAYAMSLQPSIQRRRRHELALSALTSHGFEVTRMDDLGEEVSISFDPFPGSQFGDPFLKYAEKGIPYVGDVFAIHTLLLTQEPVSDAVLRNANLKRSINQLWIRNAAITDDGLAALRELGVTDNIEIINCRITGTPLLNNSNLQQITGLNLSQSDVGDDFLRQLSSFRLLESLDLSQTRITDSGLRFITSLANLHVLNLSRTQMTNIAVRHVAILTKLKRLNLANNNVDDGCIDDLTRISSLESITVSGTLLSSKGRQRIRDALPRCVVD